MELEIFIYFRSDDERHILCSVPKWICNPEQY